MCLLDSSRRLDRRFSGCSDLLDFRKLDIETDPIQQGFAEGSYDIIVASSVLHANMRKLLKPGGQLVLMENTRDRLDMQVIFGTLPDWWGSEEPDRKMSPNASLDVGQSFQSSWPYWLSLRSAKARNRSTKTSALSRRRRTSIHRTLHQSLSSTAALFIRSNG